MDAGSDGGATGSTPNKIQCGTVPTPCTASVDQNDNTANTPACCLPDPTNAAGATTGAACATATQPCDTGNGYSLACDEAADCPKDANNGNVQEQCFFQNGNSNCADTKDDFANIFGDNSNFGPVQLCKTNAECGTGVTCALRTCKDENSVTIKLQVCGTPTGCQ